MRKNRLFRRGSAFVLLGMLLLTLLGFCAVWPEASGTDRRADGNLVVDMSNVQDGYVMVRGPEASKRLKLRIAFGETMFTYDLNTEGAFEVFQLQMGSGTYTCSLYKNVKGNQYSQEGQISFSATLEDEMAAYLCPNQYVNYTPDTPAIQKAEELCAGLDSQADKFAAIRGFVEQNFAYDFIRAVTVQGGQMPDIDYCYENKMGICQDLSAMMAGMLRSQGVPARMMIGYADKQYHAWLNVYVDGEEVFYDPTAALNGMAKPNSYTTERFY